MREDDASNLLAAVYTMRRGELDAAITASPDTHKPQPVLHITELATNPMVLATSPDHPLASRDQTPLTQLRDELMVALVGSVALAV